MTILGTVACGGGRSSNSATPAPAGSAAPPAAAASVPASDRKYVLERVDDAAVVQVYADGFAGLPLNEKILLWHLSQAAIAGRDIFYDQKYVHNLEMRDVLEAVVASKPDSDAATMAEILRYTKLFWINSGPYNNLTAKKFVLKCSPAAFADAAHAAEKAGASFPRKDGETLDGLLARLEPLFFDPNVDPTVTSKNPPQGKDILTASANNLYSGVTMGDVKEHHENYPLNSRLVKQDGRIVEEVYRVGGRYGRQLAAIIAHLERAIPYATDPMAKALRALIKFYQTGETSDREAYDIAWVQDKASPVDTINGFVEVYLDARSIKGAWEGLVFYVNREKTSEIRKLADNAQWFEDHMPWDPKYRKEGAHGITANAIDVVIETGDSGPVTPVGINLPNDQSIRERYGSKSVSLSNVNEAYDKSTPPAFRLEFSWTPEEAARASKWNALANDLTINMHEVIGHASGKVDERLKGNPQAALKEHFSALEEARADLVALYFLPDPKLAAIGLVSGADQDEIVRAEYENYVRNALVQLRRVRTGTEIEEDHMRNRQMIVRWLLANTKAIEARMGDGKT
jgi:dipeptidyl-peptidase-3